MEVKLSRAIKVEGEDVTTLKFREPRAGDFRSIKVTLGEGGLTFQTDAALDLAARLAEVPPSSINQLSFMDMIAVAGAAAPFLEGLEKTLTQQSQTSSSPAASAQEKPSG